MTTLFVVLLAAVQCVLSVVPRTGASLCLWGLECCACPSAVSGAPVVSLGKSEGCCCSDEPGGEAPRPVPADGDGCGCGCVDVWVPGSVARLELDRVPDPVWPPVQPAEPWGGELWALRACGAPAPRARSPECCGPPLVVSTTRLLI